MAKYSCLRVSKNSVIGTVMYLIVNALVLRVKLLYSILTGLALLPTSQFAFNLQAIPSLLPK